MWTKRTISLTILLEGFASNLFTEIVALANTYMLPFMRESRSSLWCARGLSSIVPFGGDLLYCITKSGGRFPLGWGTTWKEERVSMACRCRYQACCFFCSLRCHEKQKWSKSLCFFLDFFLWRRYPLFCSYCGSIRLAIPPKCLQLPLGTLSVIREKWTALFRSKRIELRT